MHLKMIYWLKENYKNDSLNGRFKMNVDAHLSRARSKGNIVHREVKSFTNDRLRVNLQDPSCTEQLLQSNYRLNGHAWSIVVFSIQCW